jgi:hypothetical protein
MLNVDRAEFHSFSVILSVAMLSVALLSVAMLSVITLNVVMMNVVAPLWYLNLGRLQPHSKILYLNECGSSLPHYGMEQRIFM